MEHAMTIAQNEVNHLLNDFMKNLGKSFKGNKIIKVTTKHKKLPLQEPRLLVEEDDLEIIIMNCCEKKIKIDNFSKIVGNPFCPYCGVS